MAGTSPKRHDSADSSSGRVQPIFRLLIIDLQKMDSPIVTVAQTDGSPNQVRREPLWLPAWAIAPVRSDFYTTGVGRSIICRVIVLSVVLVQSSRSRWGANAQELLLVGVVWWVTLLGNFQDDVWRSAIGLFEAR